VAERKEPHPLHPIIRPPEEYEHVNAPVRDDAALGPTEDLDRQPDGVPHAVVGLTALFSALLALLVAAMLLVGGTVTKVAAVVLAAIAVPVIVSSLRRKASEARDKVHPSR
jgi:uncharacterized membrane protein YphA (DoxX/SURF4 family)